MADPVVNVVLTLTDKLSQNLKKATSGMAKAMDDMAGKMNKLLGTNITGAQLAKGLGVVAGLITAVGVAAKKAVDETMNYALAMGDLSTALGINVEEASRLVQIGDDLRISQGTLTIAFRTLARQGVQPTLENIKKLGDEFKAIQNPADQTKFAMEKFGRAGMQLTRLLALTSEEIDAMAASAEAAGLIMTDEGVEAAKKYYAELDNLEDAAEGLKIQIGQGLIPILSDLAREFNRVITEVNLSNKYYELLDAALKNNIITQEQYDAALKDVAESSSLTQKEAYDFAGAIDVVQAQIEEANKSAGMLGSYAIPQISDAMAQASEDLTIWGKLVGYLTTDEEKIALATELWGDELKESNKQVLLNEKAILIDQIAMGGLTEEVEAGKLAELALIQTQLGIIDAMYDTADAVDDATTATDYYAESLGHVSWQADLAANSVSTLLDISDTSIESPISALIDDLKFMMAGGAEITVAFDMIQRALQRGLDPNVALEQLNNLIVVYHQKMAAAGLETAEEAKAAIVEELTIKPEVAEDLFNNVITAEEALKDVSVDIGVTYNGKTPEEFQKEIIDTTKIKIPEGIGAEPGLPGGGPVDLIADQTQAAANVEVITGALDTAAAAADTLKGSVDTVATAAMAVGVAVANGIIGPINTGTAAAVTLDSTLDAAAVDRTMTFNIEVTGDTWVLDLINIGGSGKFSGHTEAQGGPGGQHGLNMIVPPGYPNDTYPIRVSSGEMVTVTPQGQKSPAGTVVINNNYYDEGAAALGLAMTRKIATGRLNNSMGR